MSLSFNIKQGQRIDLWLKASEPAAQPLFSIRVNGQVVFKIQEAPRYFQYFTRTSFQDGVATTGGCRNIARYRFVTRHPDSLRARGVTFIATAGQDLRLMSGQDIVDSICGSRCVRHCISRPYRLDERP